MKSPIYNIPLTPFKKQITNECIFDQECYLKGSMPICCFKCKRVGKCEEEGVFTCDEYDCPYHEDH